MMEYNSLCMVRIYEKGEIWLLRLADLNEEELVLPNIDETQWKRFENREQLYWHDGPKEDGAIGIWAWRATPNETDPNRDYIETKYQKSNHPVRFVSLKYIDSIEELKNKLLEGLPIGRYICDTFFCYEYENRKYRGLLCKLNELKFDKETMLKEDVYFLPIYEFNESDIITTKNNIKFIKKLFLDNPKEIYRFGDAEKIIQSTILARLTWPLYKEYINKTRAEWRDCRELLQILSGEPLYETVAKKMGCTISEATEAVNKFVSKENNLFHQYDVDSEVLAKIAINNDRLRAQCEKIIEKQWKEEHIKEIDTAKKEIQTYQAQIENIKIEQQAAMSEQQSVLKKIADARSECERLQNKIKEYEVLGNDAVNAIRDKIGSAQKDMAGFIADLSVFMPKVNDQNSYNVNDVNKWTFSYGIPCDNNDTEECKNWRDTLSLLQDNLKFAGVGKWNNMLASFIYSAYINKMSLILAGPNAKAIASAVSMSITGNSLSVLKCYGKIDSDSIFSYVKAGMAAVENPFHPEWIAHIAEIANNGFSIWIYPFIEDLVIEPRSLWNYVYPVFTECFVEKLPSVEKMIAGKAQEYYGEFQSDEQYRVKTEKFKKFGINNFLTNRLNQILQDTKCMSNSNSADIEYLFGLLPISILYEKREILGEMLEYERNLTKNIQDEIQRYIEE